MAQKINEVGGKEWLIVMIVVLVGGYFAYKHETLSPSIVMIDELPNGIKRIHFHGFITNGEVIII